MSPGRLRLIPVLEKVKAGLGAAGMAAVAVEAFGPRLVGLALLGPFGGVVPIVAAITSALIAGYFTTVSEKEAALESQAAELGTRINVDQ